MQFKKDDSNQSTVNIFIFKGKLIPLLSLFNFPYITNLSMQQELLHEIKSGTVKSTCLFSIRFSKDIDTLDVNLPQFSQNLMTTLAPLLSTFIMIIYSTPIFTAVFVPLAIFFFILQVRGKLIDL